MGLKHHLTLATATILLSACATNKGTINSYTDPTFGSENIATVAIFPIRNTKAAPSEARQINRKLAVALQSVNPDVSFVNEVEAVAALDKAGLGQTWADFVTGYSVSGIPDVRKLKSVSEAIDTDTILQGEMVSVVQEDGSYGMNAGTTRVTVRYTLMDTDDGKLLWEASADGIRKTATTLGDAPPVIEAVNLAVDKIIENLPDFNP